MEDYGKKKKKKQAQGTDPAGNKPIFFYQIIFHVGPFR